MGDEARSKSLPNITDERRSRGIFRPHIIRNTSSPSDDPNDIFSAPSAGKMESSHRHYHNLFFPAERVDTSPHSSMEYLNGDPIKHGSTSDGISDETENVTAYSGSYLLPPRTSSLNALSSLNSSPEKKNEALNRIPTANSCGTIGDSDNVTFLEICQSHPQVTDNIIKTGVVITPDGKIIRTEKRTIKTPAPRISRVMGGLRNVFSRSRPEKRSKSALTFELVNNPIPTSRPAPRTPDPSENGSPQKSSKKRPFGPDILPSHDSAQTQQFRQLETTGLDSVRQTVNGLGRLLVEDDDMERRRVWYQEFILLYGLLADFNSRDLRIGEAASLVAQMRAEASLRRYAMLLQVHQISQNHDGFYAADLPSDRVVENWEQTRR
ncbi:hypothetical protein N7486_003297 [Penicillium sp. IBT 16267x]|nr:hypothetical protein N7486_003297 [Penicillium sp. IBT 16267x]